MKPTLSFHNIDSLTLGPIQHFTAAMREDGGKPFWTRSLTLKGDGGRYDFALYSNTGAAALRFDGEPLSPEETKRMAAALAEMPAPAEQATILAELQESFAADDMHGPKDEPIDEQFEAAVNAGLCCAWDCGEKAVPLRMYCAAHAAEHADF